MENKVKFVMGCGASLLTLLFGNDSQVIAGLTWLVYLMSIDMVTGFIKGHVQGNGNSKTFRAGFIKKLVNIIFVSFCYHVDKNMNLSFSVALLSIGTFSAIEGYSVIENFIALGVPVPEKIKNMFSVSKEGDTVGK